MGIDLDSSIYQPNDIAKMAESGLPLRDQIEEWRLKQKRGELTKEDMAAIIRALRDGRIAAAQAAKTPSKKAAREVSLAETDDLLKNMGI